MVMCPGTFLVHMVSKCCYKTAYLYLKTIILAKNGKKRFLDPTGDIYVSIYYQKAITLGSHCGLQMDTLHKMTKLTGLVNGNHSGNSAHL